MERRPYPSDLTEAQWRQVRGLIPPAELGGRPRSVEMREVLSAIFYLLRTWCSWRQLPHDLPPWGTVHYSYRRLRLNGAWERIHERLREPGPQAAPDHRPGGQGPVRGRGGPPRGPRGGRLHPPRPAFSHTL